MDRGRPAVREEQARVMLGGGIERRCRIFKRRAASIDPDVIQMHRTQSGTEQGEVSDGEQAITATGSETGQLVESGDQPPVGRAHRDGLTVSSGAVVGVFEELEQTAGTVIPISALKEVDRVEVCIEGVITQLWEPTCFKVQQEGLIEDESG